MKKIFILIFCLLLAPLVALAVGESAPEDPSLVAASYQQGEDADRSRPVVRKAKEPDASAEAGTKSEATESQPAVANNPIPAKAENEVSTAIIGLSQLVDDLQNNQSQLQQQQSDIKQQFLKQQYLLVGLLVFQVILCLLILLVYRKRTARNLNLTPVPAPAPALQQDNDAQSEYDFMGSSEAIPAKLDLARAYIAMEDYTAARETLAEILGEGDHENHRQEAKELLAKIN